MTKIVNLKKHTLPSITDVLTRINNTYISAVTTKYDTDELDYMKSSEGWKTLYDQCSTYLFALQLKGFRSNYLEMAYRFLDDCDQMFWNHL